jgi:hypothetical protein
MLYYDRVVEAVTADASAPDLLRQRIDLLLPIYRIKWCGIMLNHFLPVGGARRHFAGQGDAAQLQLKQAREALALVR